MDPSLVASPPLAWNVATSPPQVRYGTSKVSDFFTSPTVTLPTSVENFSCAISGVAARNRIARATAVTHFGFVNMLSLSLAVNRRITSWRVKISMRVLAMPFTVLDWRGGHVASKKPRRRDHDLLRATGVAT